MPLTNETIGAIADILGVVGAVFAFLAWINTRIIKLKAAKERKRQNQAIYVSLEDVKTGETYKVTDYLRRSQLTRAEILGILGTIPTENPSDRYQIRYLNTPEFHRSISEALDAKGEASIHIKCDHEEFRQFNMQDRTANRPPKIPRI